ncbi:patatin-like phospholipase family protein [Galbibacter sp. PAP.153]|uniref:patatin-like phospholipase family protein n=1 Tax=Galbibacter sp. PAP.153 TaxID=3104623 RepID=UPI00300BEBA4
MPKSFKLCLTMAGAVSAGSYTAGVLDYLIETLQLWQQAKDKNKALGSDHPEYDQSIPMHDVIIDVVSGASAGGITGTLSLMSLLSKKHRAVNRFNPKGENNLFYKCWVKMADDDTGKTLEKLLDTQDLDKNKLPQSLLNSIAIEKIADNALHINETVHYPPFVSKDIDLILTTTNLRGLNFKVDFSGNSQTNAANIITNHGGFFRYKVKNELFSRGVPADENSLYYVLDLKETQDIHYLRDATLSTAAFPIGLKSREIEISKKYIERYPKYLFGRRKGITPLILDNEESYKFNSIDGGLINNEPYGIGIKVLNEKNKNLQKNDNYAIVMIDPFPNQDNSPSLFNPDRDILNVAKGMFKALRNQVMFNQDGILDALSLSDRTKFLVAPSRKTIINGAAVREQHHLASSPISGFAGFMDDSLRKHDFELGRKNCQDFLRYHFSVKEENIEKRLGVTMSPESMDRFLYTIPAQGNSGKKFFPIIPDMKVTKAFNTQFDFETYGTDAVIEYPQYPKIDLHTFEHLYRKPIKKRLKMLVRSISGNWFLTFGYLLFYRRKTYKMVLETIKDSLKEAGLLQKY